MLTTRGYAVQFAGPDTFRGGLLEGAQVRTPCGPRRIEHVRRGDLIVTRHNGLQPVKMVWMRELTETEMRLQPALSPIRLTARAIGPMMPQRDLVLAPDHRMLLPGWMLKDVPDDGCGLMASKAVAGKSDAAHVDCSMDVARFYTLVFETHQIYAVNGLPVESALVTSGLLRGLSGELREEVLRHFPALRRKRSAYPPREFPVVPATKFLPAACA